MLGDAIALFNFIKEKADDEKILEGYFSSDGNKIEGSEFIKVIVTPVKDNENIWFYYVEPYLDYIFVPIPVNPNAYTDYGTANGNKNPDSNLFRYVSHPMSKFTSGGELNLKMDFFVFGYRPGDLMQLKKKS